MTESYPSREAVRRRLLDLIERRASREEVATWAAPWIRESLPTPDDLDVWESLKELAGCDLRVSPDEYLHDESDFNIWLIRLDGPKGREARS